MCINHYACAISLPVFGFSGSESCHDHSPHGHGAHGDGPRPRSRALGSLSGLRSWLTVHHHRGPRDRSWSSEGVSRIQPARRQPRSMCYHDALVKSYDVHDRMSVNRKDHFRSASHAAHEARRPNRQSRGGSVRAFNTACTQAVAREPGRPCRKNPNPPIG